LTKKKGKDLQNDQILQKEIKRKVCLEIYINSHRLLGNFENWKKIF